MTELANALYDYWNSFGIQAYKQDDPRIQDSTMPYIIYNVIQGDTLGSTNDFIIIYYSITKQQAMFELADKIRQDIGLNKVIRFNGGNVTIWQPTFQQKSDTDVSTSIYANFQIDFNLR